MTGRPNLTDDAIASMLRSRGSAPAPVDLARDIADAVATDAAAGTVAGRRARTGRRSWPLVLVAAALLIAMAGSALVLSRPTTERSTPTPGPSAIVVVPSPTTGLGDRPCADMDAIAERLGIPYADSVDPSSIVRTNGDPPANGPILVALAESTDSGATLQFLRVEPDGTTEPTRLGRGSSIEAGALTAMVPAPSGTAVALAFDPYDGPVLTSPDCADVFVMTDDFVRYRRVFRARLGERYTDPVWSSDGGRLYAIKSNSRPCEEVPVSSIRTSYDCSTPLESSVVAWDVAADEIIDFGRPCDGCRPEGQPFLSPDGGRLAVPYLDESSEYRPRVAILDDDGRWSLTPGASAGGPFAELAGWLDEGGQGRLRILLAGASIAVVDIETGTIEFRRPCDDGDPSPDGRWRAGRAPCHADEQSLSIHVTEVATGTRHRVSLPEPTTAPAQVGAMWSPDSRWLGLRVTDGAGRSAIYVAPADGTSEPRLLDHRRATPIVWAWLPAAP